MSYPDRWESLTAAHETRADVVEHPDGLCLFDTGQTAGRYMPLPFGTRKLDSQFTSGTKGYTETWYWTLD